MSQIYKKTGSCSAIEPQVKYPMRLVVGESEGDFYSFYQPWDTQPYSLRYTTVNSCDGILDITSTGTDAGITMANLGSFDPAVHKYIRIRYRVVTGTNITAQIFFFNNYSAGASSMQSVNAVMICDNEWHTIDIDISAHSLWLANGNITGWRYDWCGATGVNMQIDYMGLLREVDVHCSGHCRSDFGDIRFFDIDDNPLKYKIDWPSLAGTTPNQVVDVWVVTSPGTTDTEVVMKYSDPGLTDGSCGWEDLFIKYKNFESGDDGDLLDAVDEDFTVVSGTCEIDTGQKFEGTRSVRLVAAATTPKATFAHTAGDGYAIQFRMRKTNYVTDVSLLYHGNGTKVIKAFVDSSENIKYIDAAGVTRDTSKNCSYNSWPLYKINNINWAAGTYDLWYGNFLIQSDIPMHTSTDYPDVLVMCHNSTTQDYDAWYDEIAIRKYASPEPTWGAWGEEELIDSGPVGVKTWNTIPSANIKTWNDVLWNEIKSIT